MTSRRENDMEAEMEVIRLVLGFVKIFAPSSLYVRFS